MIDGRGKHVTPGIVDCHSHSFISGGVNEWTNSCTAEVRIADVLDGQTVDIYRQLAGGVTTADELHGSANAIGGQNAVVQLRWGEPGDALLLEGAPPGIKFALGENPRRANWTGSGMPPRYPTSRSGVEETIRERFLAARAYQRRFAEWREANDPTRISRTSGRVVSVYSIRVLIEGAPFARQPPATDRGGAHGSMRVTQSVPLSFRPHQVLGAESAPGGAT